MCGVSVTTRSMDRGYIGQFDSEQLAYLRKDAAPFTCISLFSGCGGMDLGTHQAGLVTRVMVEWDKSACDVLRLNWTTCAHRQAGTRASHSRGGDNQSAQSSHT